MPTEGAIAVILSAAKDLLISLCRKSPILVGISCLMALVLPALPVAQGQVGERPYRLGGSQGRMAARPPEAQRPVLGGFFRRLRDLPPWQQERLMANNPRFRQLPPWRQQQIRNRLRQWNAMSPEQRERVREREEIFQSLSPAQRQEARAIFPQWRALPPGRRQAVLQAFRRLRDLPPQQREPFLASPAIQERFSPQERHVLQGLARLLPDSGLNPPGEPDE